MRRAVRRNERRPSRFEAAAPAGQRQTRERPGYMSARPFAQDTRWAKAEMRQARLPKKRPSIAAIFGAKQPSFPLSGLAKIRRIATS
jgi:hypothetical protein